MKSDPFTSVVCILAMQRSDVMLKILSNKMLFVGKKHDMKQV
jgi:hypothetical protein